MSLFFGQIFSHRTFIAILLILSIPLITIARQQSYWNKGVYAPHFPVSPIFDHAGRLSWEAHLELERCGLSDDEFGRNMNDGDVLVDDSITLTAVKDTNGGMKIRKLIDGEFQSQLRLRKIEFGLSVVNCEYPA